MIRVMIWTATFRLRPPVPRDLGHTATSSGELALQAAELAPADFREEDVGGKPSKLHP
jgi:hypothetical protein